MTTAGAQIAAPSTFQSRKVRYGIRVIPATPGTSARNSPTQRPTSTAGPPRRSIEASAFAHRSSPTHRPTRLSPQPRAKSPPEFVTDRISCDGGDERSRNHDREADVALRGGEPANEQGRLPGKYKADERCRLRRCQRRDDQVQPWRRQSGQAVDQCVHRGDRIAAVS